MVLIEHHCILVENEWCAYNYTLLDDASRNKGNGVGPDCDKSDSSAKSPDWNGEGWYRIVEPAGTMIPESMSGAGKTLIRRLLSALG